jgi:hypothetical protein
MELTKSIHYIEENGSDLEKARLHQILYDMKPESEVVRPFVELQNRDGGFPLNKVKGVRSTVNDTLNALWWMEELGMLGSPAADQAMDYLFEAQQEDGGWDEDPGLAQDDLPPWILPGDPRTRLYLTAYAAYWLTLKGYGSFPAFQNAILFIYEHLNERDGFRGFLHTTWIAASVFFMAGYPYGEAARAGLQILIDKPFSEWADSQIAWALDCLGKAGLSQEEPFIDIGIKELPRRHSSDGSWSSEDGAAFAVSATISALKVLKHFGCLP